MKYQIISILVAYISNGEATVHYGYGFSTTTRPIIATTYPTLVFPVQKPSSSYISPLNQFYTQLNTAYPEPNTLYPRIGPITSQLSKLHPKPGTIYPKPSTLHPHPSPFHLKPTTLHSHLDHLHSHPIKLNPEPSTLHPKLKYNFLEETPSTSHSLQTVPYPHPSLLNPESKYNFLAENPPGAAFMAAYKALLEHEHKKQNALSQSLFPVDPPILPVEPPLVQDVTNAALQSPLEYSHSESENFPKGVDFSKATRTEDGRSCIVKIDMIESMAKDPILRCEHKTENKCHYTYITYFKPSKDEVCKEHFEKSCTIMFNKKAVTETVRKCYKPQQKVCDGTGEEECRTVYETACTTKYIKNGPGKFVGDTKCEKLPLIICGKGCVIKQGPEECHDKQIDTLVDIPEETCDLNPMKICKPVTKLVPSLKPKEECATVLIEICNLDYSESKVKMVPLRTEWCMDEEEEVRSGYGNR